MEKEEKKVEEDLGGEDASDAEENEGTKQAGDDYGEVYDEHDVTLF